MALISAAITNLRKYNEGILDFTWLDLPATESEFNSALEKVGIGELDSFGSPYEEWFVSDYDDESYCDIARILGEYPDLEDMNKAAAYAEELADADDLWKLRGFIEDHGLDSRQYDLDDIYDVDDEVIIDMAKDHLENGRGLHGLYFFLGDYRPITEYVEINGYANLSAIEDLDERLGEVRKAILKDIV